MTFLARAARRPLTSVLLGVAALLCVPSAASALPISRNTDSVPGIQGSLTEIPVKCPQGTNFVSGGWSSDEDAGDDGVNIVEALWDGNRTWTITVQRFTNSTVAQDVTALARCGERAPKLKLKAATKAPSGAAPDGTMRARATCGKGQIATAGGFAQPNLDENFDAGGSVLENQRIGTKAWSVKTTPVNSAGKLRVQAYCTKDRGTRFVSRTEFHTGFGETTSSTKVCGAEARAGGWIVEQDGVSEPRFVNYRFSPLEKGWSTSIVDFVGFQGSLTSYGYCP